MMNLVRSELLKIRTTSTWWLLAIGAFLATAVAFAFNAWITHVSLTGDPAEIGLPPEEAAAQADVAGQAANLYTSGQFFGLLLVMLIGILMVTNEFFHQTATTTFLSTPRRTSVIASKLIAASAMGFVFWLVTTVIALVAGVIFMSVNDFGTQLGEWEVHRALLLNLLAYAIWTVLGVGLGTLITNQLGAVITASVVYLVGTQVVGLLFLLLSNLLDSEAILEWQVVWPAMASQIMISGIDSPMLPPWWTGALVLVAYAVAAGLAGVMITRRRDIS
ncbi:ABC transporter permease [Micromonospora echinospora]|uniref:ABC-2 family transporter protein n=1 Tax=Micromonospora echinospora TaxID=1877 RepID=A0A1C4XK85_MICEC|nr:ABC transporter permease [Micromonospora echinospora]OZV82485.1 ABC transporter permease [Micromonospora echinospora]SCF08833.1 ABC-2 family transporter protein [Micromonospora echinospora]